MSEERINQLLQELKKEIENETDLNDEARELVNRFESGLTEVLDPEINTEENTLMDDAIALEASFATHYPVAEKILRELVNSLSKIGI